MRETVSITQETTHIQTMKLATVLFRLYLIAAIVSMASSKKKNSDKKESGKQEGFRTTGTYYYPRFGGYRLDYCFSSSESSCGQDAANGFCVKRGFQVATTFRMVGDNLLDRPCTLAGQRTETSGLSRSIASEKRINLLLSPEYFFTINENLTLVVTFLVL